MKLKLVTVALLFLVAASSAQPATAGSRHATAKVGRHAMSERVRNAQAYSAPVVINSAAGAPSYFDEALSPPAGR